ncbi:uracil-DNA glycosylase [Neoehrlichia mikurensis]|uniref:uracil-DNA glycosylase n=1 Tax=Neoehrlichia mikurensis TaxID=89586 RepID=A0A9Q9BW23_9RICK|nr:uracil-DNA glycosylase [Neoehrlichia mikurensis]QXK92286.1 uracil-DNA glycosylase [Neoehrlichia mikurensis]QXK92740.1 uracil-DNA glycosylase [Neoehrlichia mikurensis]QXK93981.1 uracil-DNA glycosylase [Neoehrlichia mikurensis]UTO55856.1 uracil-DNA glycosylase [Neoehrlichia mikurensis]UTO56771.1 uracil-DNA glycosylase [Neoehrlichia mikurensis]
MSEELLEVLKFYHDSGIDNILDDDITEIPQNTGVQLDNSITLQDDNSITLQENIDWINIANRLAANCKSLDDLKQIVNSFDGCAIKKFATNTVFSDGNPCAKVMLIGEAPGANEDMEGKPFCGVSGKLLDKMLSAINLDREKVYISNTVFWRPPGNRRPSDCEISMCKPFVEKHIALISPKMLILVGSTACYALLDSQNTISKLRTKFHTYTNQFLEHSITTAVIFHPAYLLRQPMQKRLAWEDLQKIRDYLEENSI